MFGASQLIYSKWRRNCLRQADPVHTDVKAGSNHLDDENPSLFDYFSEIWDVRNNHMDKSLPEKYVFMLRCCGKSGCPHPLCQEGKISKRNKSAKVSKFSKLKLN